MQLNQALFMLGGRSGYVLQPDIMRDETFDPFDKNSLKIVEPITVQLQASVQGLRDHLEVVTIKMGTPSLYLGQPEVVFYLFQLYICSIEVVTLGNPSSSRVARPHPPLPPFSPTDPRCPAPAQKREEHRVPLRGGGGLRLRV